MMCCRRVLEVTFSPQTSSTLLNIILTVSEVLLAELTVLCLIFFCKFILCIWIVLENFVLPALLYVTTAWSQIMWLSRSQMPISYSFTKNVGGYHLLERDAVWSHRSLPTFQRNISELLADCTASHLSHCPENVRSNKKCVRIPYPEDEGIMFLWNVYSHLPNCTVS
jgi:hypothetical protein